MTILPDGRLAAQPNTPLGRARYQHHPNPIAVFGITFIKKVIYRIKYILKDRGIIAAGIGLAVLYWVVESLIMAVIFKEPNFSSQLLNPNAHEIWSRFLVISIIIIFSLTNQSIFNRHSRTREKLIELSNHLEQIVKQRTAELAATNELLQEQIDQKVNFTRTIVHELKTPLTPMIGASEMLIERTKDDEVLSRLTININRGAQKLNRRISDLTDLAKGEIGLLSVNYKPFDLLQAVHELVDYVKINAERKRQSIVLDLPASFPTVWADEDRTRQVILNLLDNAIKFTPQYGRIAVKLDASRNNFIIHVKDNGCGIDEEEQKHLFELYWCSKNKKTSLSGLGIGLPLSKMFVELQGGQMWVKSKKGAGSTFSFSIPMILPKSSANNI